MAGRRKEPIVVDPSITEIVEKVMERVTGGVATAFDGVAMVFLERFEERLSKLESLDGRTTLNAAAALTGDAPAPEPDAPTPDEAIPVFEKIEARLDALEKAVGINSRETSLRHIRASL